MKMKKVYIALIVIILILFVVLFLVFGLDNIKKEKYSTTIVVGNDVVWSLNNKKWINLDSYNELNWKKFNIYIDREEFGKYYLWYDKKWYLFDKDKNAVNYDGDMIAYKANYNIPIYNYSLEEIDDYTYVNKVLSDNDLSSGDFTAKQKIVFDFDNDGIEEEFYLISNVFSNFDSDKVFSIVFMVKNDKIYNVYKDIQKNSSFNGCKPYYRAFLDIDNDNKYEFILSCSGYSVSHTSNMLYEFEKDEFKIVISN